MRRIKENLSPRILSGVQFSPHMVTINKMHNPPHPGKVLQEYLPESRTLVDVTTRLGVTRQAVPAVLNGRAAVRAEMAVRLSKALNTSAEL